MKKLVLDHLKEARLMQLATVSDGRPWVCTLYFVCDGDLRFYWLSLPSRRHSKELANNTGCGIAIAVNDRQPVIGIQAEGTAEQIGDLREVAKILPKYVKKYGNGKDFVTAMKQGTGQHRLYRFTPNELVLFDEVNYPKDPRQTVISS